MKKGIDLTSRSSIALSKAIAHVEELEARAYLTGVVLGTPQDTVPSGISTSFATLNTSTGANADFNNDGKTDLVVFRPSTGGWFVRLSSLGYDVNQYQYYQWGLPGDTLLTR